MRAAASHAPPLGVVRTISIADVLILANAFIALLCDALTIDLISPTHSNISWAAARWSRQHLLMRECASGSSSAVPSRAAAIVRFTAVERPEMKSERVRSGSFATTATRRPQLGQLRALK